MTQLPTLAELVDPRRTALVVVDVQNDFCDPARTPEAGAMLPTLRQVIEEARWADVLIIYTKASHSDKTNSPVWLTRFASRPAQATTCQEGTPGEAMHPDFQPQPGELVVVKHRYSAFIGTNFEIMLRAHHVETLVFAGIATNVCVESTVRDAFQRDYWTVVLSDSTATGSEAEHQTTLAVIGKHFGLVAESTEIVDAWRRAAAAQPLLAAQPAVAADRRR